jgi:cytochrome c
MQPRRVLGTALGLVGAIVCAGLITASGATQSASHGKELFERRCGGCHSMDRDKTGPRLKNVYGKPAASVATFTYSDALKNAHVVWNAEALDQWLLEPEKLVPDNDMAFRLQNPDERREIIAYLKEVAAK